MFAGSQFSAHPTGVTTINGELYFGASTTNSPLGLWQSDGTAAGSHLLKTIYGAGITSITEPTVINGELYFIANWQGADILGHPNGTYNGQLWKSDGTAAGTVQVQALSSNDALRSHIGALNGQLLYWAYSGTTPQLWTTDGTTRTLIGSISGGGSISDFSQQLGGRLYFAANDGINGTELWVTDGTAAGTHLFLDLVTGAGSSNPSNLTVAGGDLYFSATTASGTELYGTDGSSSWFWDINPGTASSLPNNLVAVGNTLYFTANDGVHGTELWKANGRQDDLVVDLRPGSASSTPTNLTNVNGVLYFEAFDGTSEGLYRSDGTAAGTVEIATGVDPSAGIGFGTDSLPAAHDDFNGDGTADVLWRDSSGQGLADWSMTGGSISSATITSNGSVVAPDSSWSVSGISDFDGDGRTDVLWRSTNGSLVEWSMNGSTISSSSAVTFGGAAVTPDSSWSVAAVGDFNGDGKSDVLWRNASGEATVWLMNGSTVVSSADVTSNGAAVAPGASWSVAGVGDFNGDGYSDILWRNSSGEIVDWQMNGTTIQSAADLTSNGAAVAPDSSWSVAGIGDFDGNGSSDILWRNTSGSLVEWLMNGSTIVSSGSITSGGTAITPDASWHVVTIGDFDGNGASDILWRSDSGVLAEWLMNGTAITSSVTPNAGAGAVTPGGSWTTLAKPTDFA